MSSPVSIQSYNEYKSDGYTSLPELRLKADDVAELHAEIDRIVSTYPIDDTMFDESGTGKIKQIQELHKKSEAFARLVERIRPAAQELTGSKNLRVLNVQMFEKHPGISKPTRSHQDNAYFKLKPANAITFWVALDDIDEENGALSYAPKTHLTPTRKHVRYHKATTFRVRSGVPGLSVCLKEHPEETDIRVDVTAGTVLAHHCNTIHRAGKNNSESRRRRAIGLVFIPEECGPDERLHAYHAAQLAEDIKLQEVKNPVLYAKLSGASEDSR